MKRKLHFISTLVGMSILGLCLNACSVTTIPTITPTPYIIVITLSPTTDMGIYETQVAETIYVGLTETALAQPSATPLPPSATPEPSSTSTPAATMTQTSSNNYWVLPQNNQWNPPVPPKETLSSSSSDEEWRCSITYQLVGNNAVYGTYEDFDARWTVKNTGTATWDAGSVDYYYKSGTAMHKHNDGYDLPESVSPGESITLVVDMQAPGSEGTYETYWALSGDDGSFCNLPVRIKVDD
jgi:hypothetical protein